MVGEGGLEPPCLIQALDPEPSVSTNSTIRPTVLNFNKNISKNIPDFIPALIYTKNNKFSLLYKIKIVLPILLQRD